MRSARRVGLYLDSRTILRNPGYLEALRTELGLNLVIISFTGELPGEVVVQSPFDVAPPSEERVRSLICRHLDGRPSTDKLGSADRCVGPHLSAGGDDEALRESIRRAHDVGLDVWLLAGGWTASDYDMLMYCPSQERVNRWYEAVYTHLATDYGVEGLDVTHARFPMTSEPRGMFLCTCDDCARAAAEMGYDMAKMKADIIGSLEELKRIEGKRLMAVGHGDLPLGTFDFMQLVGVREGVIRWFKFRSDLLARNLRRFREAVHATAGEGFIFGADTYPASLSMFVGHNHARWADFSDFASPLLSHVDIFPMQTMVVWAQFLQSCVAGLAEAEALRVIYRLVGYDGLGMPTSIADYALGTPDCEFRNIPLRDFVALDMAKAKLYLPEGIPCYPIIQGGGAPHDWPREIIEELMTDAEQIGHDGVIFQGTRSLVDFELDAS